MVSDVEKVTRIAGTISHCGVAVFLGEACTRPPDPESHVLNALTVADELLILVTPTPDTLKERGTPAFLDSNVVWLAIGVAIARGIQIRGLLLEGLTVETDVNDDPNIPVFIKKDLLFQPMEEYL